MLKWRFGSKLNVFFLLANVALLFMQLTWLHSAIDSTPKATTVHCTNIDGKSDREESPAQPWLGNPFVRWNNNWDGREKAFQDSVRAKRPRGQRRIFLVRHGQYFPKGPRVGQLTALGKQQAHKTGQRLKLMNTTFDVFIASTSKRASETADIIHEYISNIEIIRAPLLKEGWPSFPEPPVTYWDPKNQQFELDGKRIHEAYTKFIHRADTPDNTNEIIVAHGNIIANFILRALQGPPERWLHLAVYQGSITIMDVLSDGRVLLRSAGDLGHLPTNMWTT